MADSARALRLAGTIKKLVARALEKEIKDPRLGFVTITDVRVTGDLQQASVFYTVYGGDEERAGTAAALASAKGRLRSLVGQELGIRLTPSLEFHLDAVPETAATLDKALHEAQQRDAELAKLRENAAYAGDEDPYRRPEDRDADGRDAEADGQGS
ncbi:30S ribosome-binding factor RbfA [Demequina sp. SO4-18]|uniref:30S ribosome-binding factor RbfA n=1 Tax=Demequina sp. SO4-18 TaxID=3401026 RepID=UPI003B59E68C